MSITDELRDYVSHYSVVGSTKDKLLTAIADRIDAEYQKAEDEWKAKDGQTWLRGYGECHAEMMEGNEVIAADLERNGWVRLPKDADGEYIHVGDVMVYADGNTCPMKVVALVPPAIFLTEDGPRYADMCRHKPPTVEDVLREFSCVLMGKREFDGDVTEAIAKYAAKLQLRED